LIVVDTNILAYFFVDGVFSREAEKVYKKDPHWAAPVLWRSEFRNFLIKCVSKGKPEMDDALDIMRSAEVLMGENEYAVPSDDILRLACAARCTAYDAEYVVLARGLGVKLVTSDAALLKAFPDTAVSPERFITAR
jgi:predicted nucleic acid-binding protein